nr:hypothetical protein [Haloferax lucentense]
MTVEVFVWESACEVAVTVLQVENTSNDEVVPDFYTAGEVVVQINEEAGASVLSPCSVKGFADYD